MYVEGLEEGDVMLLTPELQYRFKRMVHNAPGAFDGVEWGFGFRDTHSVLGPLTTYLSYKEGELKCAIYTWWHGVIPLPFPNKEGGLHDSYTALVPKTIEQMRQTMDDNTSRKKELIEAWVVSVGGEIKEKE